MHSHKWSGTGQIILLVMAAVSLIILPSLYALGDASKFTPALLNYRGKKAGNTSALQYIQQLLRDRTSVKVGNQVLNVTLDSRELYMHPFAWMTGAEGFNPLAESHINNLRRYLQAGGTLIIDDASGEQDSEFLRSARRMLNRVFPEKPLRSVPEKHAIYRSYYYLDGPAGLHQISNTLHAIHVDKRAAVIISPNDLSGALERRDGRWRHSIAMGRRDERKLAKRLAVNLVIYAMTVNYKLDQVHVSYQLRHPNRYPEADSLSPSEDSGQR